MKLRNRALLSLVSGLLLLAPASRAVAQTVTATVSLPGGPVAVDVNPVTHQAYVANLTGGRNCNPILNRCTYWDVTNATAINGSTNSPATLWSSQGYVLGLGLPNAPGSVAANPITNQTYALAAGSGNVFVIDGATSAVTATNATLVWAVTVNPVTNKIYGAYNNSVFFYSPPSGFTVMDGTSNAVTTVTVPGVVSPVAIDLNPVTNKIYMANNGSANVTVIDGTTNAFSNVPAGNSPVALAVNPITNKVYVVNNATNGTVTVIDGATNATTTVSVGGAPTALGINPVTNKIYVANNGSNNITVIDGATNATATLTDSTASQPTAVAVDVLTNQIYVANAGSATITVIDGTSNALTTVSNPNGGTTQISPDPVTNTVYALDVGGNSVTVIAGAAGSAAPDFALGETSASLTLPSGGGQATDTIIVGPPYGNTVDLSCSVSGPAPVPSCELSATSVTPGPTYGTATLTMTAPAAATMLAPSLHPRLGGLYAAWLPLTFGITLMGGSRKRRGQWLLVGFLLLLLLWQVACGGNGTGQTTHTQTNYTVTVTGTSGAIQHTAQVAVTVE
jgi:YVTN family beta-propeller protein